MFLLYTSLLLITNVIYIKIDVNALQCKDETNQSVDWYVLYKIPKISQSSNPLIRQGVAYLYMTNNSIKGDWKLSSKGVDANDSIPANTLQPLYNNRQIANKLWIAYNDDPPNKSANPKYGHAKGVVIVSESGGLWLIHSVPNFPPVPDAIKNINYTTNDTNASNITAEKYVYPTSGITYGQSFLCISLNKDQINLLGQQLIYNQIIVYGKNLPTALSKQYPVLKDAANQIRIRDPPYYHKVVIKSLESLDFVSFAKSDKWQKDLYDDFVAPQLQSDMYAETWLNGRGRLPSDCSAVKVFNVQSIVLRVADVTFPSTHDHSKWAISVSSRRNQSWTCIGDINRADTQYNRGGGAVCFNLFSVWKNYRDAVNNVEPCPR